MALVLFTQGEDISLQNMVNKLAPQTLVLKLYKNSHTPAKADTEASYTEATFTGYAAKTLTPASWVSSGANPTTITYAIQTFTSTSNQAAQIIYGYYITQLGSGKAMWAESFIDAQGNATPQVIQFNVDFVTVTPSYARS